MEAVIGTVKPISIEEEMRGSYLDYAMSVIISRALPDVRDGLKPVHRRILYAMDGLGLRHTAGYKKSARIVGEVLGKYHPHGDTAVYDAMVRMAQDFSMRCLLVDGQGNFGSVDNDPAAAMRYTEARMAAIAEEMLADIDEDTVDFVPNFDGTLQEPTVLPARLPNLLVNGSSGIAVGMATNIPPHNLEEVCTAVEYLVDNPEAGVDELAEIVKGPDFPTAGIILGREGIKNAYATGQGRVVVRAKVALEEPSTTGRRQIVVTELPYQTNKAALVERIAEQVKEKKLEGISELRDESDRQGMRIVIELKREAAPEQVLNNLYKQTALQSTFFVNMLALVEAQPRVINLREALQYFIDFRREVITRRSRFQLKRAGERAHILEGLKIALDNLDQVIATIRKSQNAETARTNLMRGFGLSQLQAQAILDMQLRRLAALERRKIADEYAEVVQTIARLEDLLANPRKILYLVKEETLELRSKHGDPRRTQISDQEAVVFRDEDLIPHQEGLVTLSNRGYVKRVSSDTYKGQRRGGKGLMGMVTREADWVRFLVVADTHDNLLFFTNVGRVFRLKCYEIPLDTSRSTKGTPVINLLPIEPNERVTALVNVASFTPGIFMVLATRCGEVKRTALEGFTSVRNVGLVAMDLEAGDELVAANLAGGEEEVILVTARGQAIRFALRGLRATARTSGGVRGIRLASGDGVVAQASIRPQDYFLVITENGFGKVSRVLSYPLQGRSGGGVRTFKVTPKTGQIAAACPVKLSQELMVISAQGVVIRTAVGGIPIQGRDTQGASVMRLRSGNKVVSIACLDRPGAGRRRGGEGKAAAEATPPPSK